MNEPGPAIVVLRDAAIRSNHNSFDAIRSWVQSMYPEFSTDFRVVELPESIENWDGVRLFVPWVLDPVQLWSPTVYEQILAMQQRCDERQIPIINRIERQIRAGKFQTAQAVTAAGLRAPRMLPISNLKSMDPSQFQELKYPFMVRENWGHQGNIVRIETPNDLTSETLQSLVNPVAIEIVDVSDLAQGWFQLRRYLACGPFGISVYAKKSRNWIVRDHNAETGPDAVAENQQYVDHEDVNHQRLQSLARMLGLDVLAIDYSIDRDGRVVVWEVNPYTRFRFHAGATASATAAAHRAASAVVSLCRMRAGLHVTKSMIARLGYAADQVPITTE